jgi:GH25 family lysozyme M1 (1,4-beta-N-acetylmuramidase)
MFDGSIPLNGIDISEHQGDDINWDKVKSSGIDFVFIRAGYRASDDGSLRKDKLFEKNAREASKAGLMVGAYFYSQALNAVEGKEEAEYLLEAVKDFDITMPLVIDYEIYKDGRLDLKIQAGEMYAASFYHDAVLGFTHTVEAAGYESAVYASQDMLTNYMQADIIDDMATIWLAKYDRGAYLDANYWFWQCSDTGRAGGIKGKVDQNFWYMEPEKVYETRAKHSKSAVSIGKCRISFKRSKAKLHNFRAEPNYAMTYEGMGMTEGRDYVASVVHNIQEGTGYIIIRGIGKYKDWIMYPFAIE